VSKVSEEWSEEERERGGPTRLGSYTRRHLSLLAPHLPGSDSLWATLARTRSSNLSLSGTFLAPSVRFPNLIYLSTLGRAAPGHDFQKGVSMAEGYPGLRRPALGARSGTDSGSENAPRRFRRRPAPRPARPCAPRGPEGRSVRPRAELISDEKPPVRYRSRKLLGGGQHCHAAGPALRVRLATLACARARQSHHAPARPKAFRPFLSRRALGSTSRLVSLQRVGWLGRSSSKCRFTSAALPACWAKRSGNVVG